MLLFSSLRDVPGGAANGALSVTVYSCFAPGYSGAQFQKETPTHLKYTSEGLLRCGKTVRQICVLSTNCQISTGSLMYDWHKSANFSEIVDCKSNFHFVRVNSTFLQEIDEFAISIILTLDIINKS
ncbi:MAG: hypothetical protein IJ088_12750, partial [Clostridia bacterium]|nr:hypothetical protein [Clostridia bacterium]